MALTTLRAVLARAKEKPYKLSDERGMYLLVHPKGGKWWRLDYRYQGKRKTLALGTYPVTSLKHARKKRDEAKLLLEDHAGSRVVTPCTRLENPFPRSQRGTRANVVFCITVFCLCGRIIC